MDFVFEIHTLKNYEREFTLWLFNATWEKRICPNSNEFDSLVIYSICINPLPSVVSLTDVKPTLRKVIHDHQIAALSVQFFSNDSLYICHSCRQLLLDMIPKYELQCYRI